MWKKAVTNQFLNLVLPRIYELCHIISAIKSFSSKHTEDCWIQCTFFKVHKKIILVFLNALCYLKVNSILYLPILLIYIEQPLDPENLSEK